MPVDMELKNLYVRFGGAAGTVLDQDEVEFVDYNDDADELGGRATMRFKNIDGENNAAVEIGKEVEIFGEYGTEGSASLKWHGVIQDINISSDNPKMGKLLVSAMQYGYWQLITTYVTKSYTNQTAGYIIKDLLDTYTDIDTTNVNLSTPSTTVSGGWDNVPLLDVMQDVMQQVDGTLYISPSDYAYWGARAAINSGVSLTSEKVTRRTVKKSDLSLSNDVKVLGALREEIDQQGNARSTDSTVTSSTRELVKITLSSAVTKISKVVIYVDKTGQGSGEGLFVRMQHDNGTGTAPEAVADYNYDICRRQLTDQFLASGGDTTFLMIDNYIEADQRDVWLIVESDGASGVDVGVDSGGDLYYKIYHEDEAEATATDATSKSTYGTFMSVIINRELQTDAQCQSVADGVITKRKTAFRSLLVSVLNKELFEDVDVREYVTVTLADLSLSAVAMVLTARQVTFDSSISQKEISVNDTYEEGYRLFNEADVIKEQERRITRMERTVERVEAKEGTRSYESIAGTHGNDAHDAEVKAFTTITGPPTGLVTGARHGEAAHKEVWDYVYLPHPCWFAVSAFLNGDAWYLDDTASETAATRVKIPPHIDGAKDLEVVFLIAPSQNQTVGDQVRLLWNMGIGNPTDSTWDQQSDERSVTVSNTAGYIQEVTFTWDASTDAILAAGWAKISLGRLGSHADDDRNDDLMFFGAYIRYKTTKMGVEV